MHSRLACNARAYPRACPDCSARVFYFSCDCGSKVFFDELGSGWPLHACGGASTPQIFRGHSLNDGSVVATLLSDGSITFTRPAPLPAPVQSQQQARDEVPPPIRRRAAIAGHVFEGFAVVRELVPVTDVFERLCVPHTSMGTAILGDLARGSVTQVTAHAPMAQGNFESYTFLAPSRLLLRERVAIGGQVHIRLEGGRVLGRGAFWRVVGISLAS